MTGNDRRFVLEQVRVFDAPAEQVFGLLTEPAGLTRWWGPHGFATPEIQIDLRVGGSLLFTMQPPEGESFHLSGEFITIEFPSRLEFTFRWDEPVPDDRETVVELSLASSGGRTTVTLTQGDFATEERLELHRSGWAESFEKLDAVLHA
ncbi:SRPBCC family protein [Nocardioides iriomotensis]|uniref:SRPBCC domain-containing protein n=1 Tax=Nocardioides iriomotensis TaxID=715784 RepID=A0A4Q5J732_9ACTN|nr:SRPBCC domain-containing protein [Nocardioides iriomotensis]RYU14323.1 SRPBCC domain-containing protein [Nocardioides iriomotensis]